MRREIFPLFICVFLILFILSVSAEIMISQPKGTYNIGESLNLSVGVSEGSKQLEASLVCGDNSKLMLLKNLGPDETEIKIFQPLTKSFLGEMTGICALEVLYGSEKTTSQEFKISGFIDISLSIANLNYKAGDSIIVEGEAKKENQQPVEGFVEINLENTAIKLTDNVKQGKFYVNFSLPENIVGGRYNLKARVYEKDKEGEIGSEGERTVVIGVKQEPKKIEIAINKQTIVPGENVIFRVFLYDQANYEMPGDASVIVKDTENNDIYKRLVKTNEETSFPTESNATPGYWEIEASSLGITSKRIFSIEESEKADFEIINDTLTITNIGNVVYKKAVQISIGGEVEIKELNLEVGESKSFRLLAPNGNYNIAITDGTNTFSESDVSLTGNIIGVLDIKKQLSVWRRYPIVWLFLILVAGLFILMLMQRTIKRKSYAYPVEKRAEKIRGGKTLGFIKTIGKREPPEAKIEPKNLEAEHTLVLGGKKQNSALICLKIKNQISKETEKNLEQAFKEAYDFRALPYSTGNYRFLIFSPIITKTFKNYVPAVKATQGIFRAIKEHNSKFKDKIDFGISVHCGELASKIDPADKKLKFTAIGNALGKAKRIADLSDQEVLLTKEIHEKTIPEIKAEKQEKEGQEIWKIQKIIDTQRDKEFVRDVLKKLNEESGKKK